MRVGVRVLQVGPGGERAAGIVPGNHRDMDIVIGFHRREIFLDPGVEIRPPGVPRPGPAEGHDADVTAFFVIDRHGVPLSV